MSDDLIKTLHMIADEFETIGERGCHEAEPTKTLPRSFVVAQIRGVARSVELAREAVEAVKRQEEQS